VSARGRVVAQVNRVTTNTVQYLHRDHEQSVVEVTSAAGAIVQSLAYDAWGLRRGPANWAPLGSPFGGTQPTERGYTGHEHLDTVELVHMNGRVQDPKLGLFISADPFVQAPYHSQSHNRYAYVWNNPVSMVDPSGFQADCDPPAEKCIEIRLPHDQPGRGLDDFNWGYSPGPEFSEEYIRAYVCLMTTGSACVDDDQNVENTSTLPVSTNADGQTSARLEHEFRSMFTGSDSQYALWPVFATGMLEAPKPGSIVTGSPRDRSLRLLDQQLRLSGDRSFTHTGEAVEGLIWTGVRFAEYGGYGYGTIATGRTAYQLWSTLRRSSAFRPLMLAAPALAADNASLVDDYVMLTARGLKQVPTEIRLAQTTRSVIELEPKVIRLPDVNPNPFALTP
jgi:RHS repeat-associated protein